MHRRGLGACLAPVMIANFLPYVLHFVHRGRKFASSTGTIQALGVPCGTSLNGGVLKYDHIAERGSTSVGLHTSMYAPLPRETFSDSVALYSTPFRGFLGACQAPGARRTCIKGAMCC